MVLLNYAIFSYFIFCSQPELKIEKDVSHSSHIDFVQQDVRSSISLLRTIEGVFYFLPDGLHGFYEKNGHSQIMDISNWSSISDLPDQVDKISHITQTDKGLIALTYQVDRIVQVIDVLTGEIYQTYTVNANSPFSGLIDISSSGDRLVLVSDKDIMKVYETYTGNIIFIHNNTLNGERVKPIYSLAISNEGNFVLIVNEWSGATLIDIINQQITATFFDVYAIVSRVRFSSTDHYALILSMGNFSKYEHIEGEIKVINIQNKTVMHNLFIRDELISYAEFSPDEKYIVSASDSSGILTVWDVQTGEILTQASHGGRFVYDIDFSVDGSKFVLLFDDGYSQIWDFSAFTSSGVQDYSLYR
ncbi:MAG: hypothetical protein C4527_20320 [Candidatus Omnitrophota bacterium]|jgi:WD40 repeat protein|nr:MAG: hypothetical protein C4527_20320 [Candidatus Omnitrophota bacterium]